MARFFTIFLLLSIVVSTLKAEEHHENNTIVKEEGKEDHDKDIGHKEGGAQLHGHGKEKEGVKHDEHVGKKEEHHKEAEGVNKEGDHKGEVKKEDHHKEGEGVKKEEHHVAGKEEGVKKGEHHNEGDHKAGESVKKEEHHVAGEGVKKELHVEGNGTESVKKEEQYGERKGYEGVRNPRIDERRRAGMQGPYPPKYEPRNRSRPWSSLNPDEQEAKVKAARMNNVIINGVPEKENEDMRETVVEIGHKLGFEYPLDDVDTAYRLVCTKEPRPIIIRLVDMHIKAQWIIAYRRSRLWKEQLYMEEHLTKNTQKLSHLARIWATGRGYPHVWTWHGDVYYRMRDNPLRYKIINMEHLQKLQADEHANEVTDTPPAPKY